MVKFENTLDVRPLDDGRNWLVLEDFYYDSDVVLANSATWIQVNGVATGSRIVVPKGFITDFASIPRPLWAIVGGPTEGRYRKIAVVHDWLYRSPGLTTRGQADSVLLEGMKFSGCSWWQRSVIYSGVRVGGSGSYKGGL